MWRIICLSFKKGAEGLTQRQRNRLVGCTPRRYHISVEGNTVEVDENRLGPVETQLRSFGVTKFSCAKVDQPEEKSQ